MTEEIKRNECFIDFLCQDNTSKNCAHFKERSSGENVCAYALFIDGGVGCFSALAQVNAMVLKLKKEGIVINE